MGTFTQYKAYNISATERSLAIALVRRYSHTSNTRKLACKHYSDALEVIQRHASTTSHQQIVSLFESLTHTLNYPSNDFVNATNELWRSCRC